MSKDKKMGTERKRKSTNVAKNGPIWGIWVKGVREFFVLFFATFL
jgi:hypothetical protein